MRQYVTNEIIQTPAENRPALINWDIELPAGVTILSSEFIVDSTDYTIEAASFVLRATSFRLTGGIAGNAYNITNRITCSDSEVLEATIPFVCQQYNFVGVQY